MRSLARLLVVLSALLHVTVRSLLILPLNVHPTTAKPTSTPVPDVVLGGRRCNGRTGITAHDALSGDDVGPSDAGHIAMIAVGSKYREELQRVVADVLNHTDAHSAWVVHLLVQPHSADIGPLLAVLPRCDRLAYRLVDVDALPSTIADFAHVCNTVLQRDPRGCMFLVKAFLHELLPPAVGAIIALDLDIRVLGDVGALLREELPAMRASGTVLGLVRELQPQYLAAGLGFGFNGGVQLHDLAGMRRSAAYQRFLATASWGERAPIYANDGDQTVYVLLNNTAPSLIYELPCGWNVALCVGRWPAAIVDAARASGFDYVGCRGAIGIAHGNCATYATYGMGHLDVSHVVDLVQRVQDAARNYFALDLAPDVFSS